MAIDKQRIRCGEQIVGFVSIDNVDMFHVLGHFEPGPDFSQYAAALHRLQKLMAEFETDATENWIDELESINDFGFVIELRNGKVQPIRDFKLVRDDYVEFKLCD